MAQEIPMAMSTTVVVNPGDMGSRFQTFDGEFNAYNRMIIVPKARAMGKNWDEITDSRVLYLMRMKDDLDKFWIIDGQHRIHYGSEVLKQPSIHHAMIYEDVEDIPKDGNYAVPDFICSLNSEGQQFTLNQHLHNYKGISPWPEVFAAWGIHPTFNAGKTTLSWANIIRAAVLIDNSENPRNPDQKKRPDTGSSSKKKVIAAWRDWPQDKIMDMAEIMAWWGPIAQHVKTVLSLPKRPFTSMYSYTLIMLAGLMYRHTENKDLLEISEIAPRLAVNETRYFAGVSQGGQMGEHTYRFLSIINRKRQKHFVNIFGETGR
jgi:hypothetical protein